MGSRRTDGQTRGLLIHDPKIVADTVSVAESSFSEAGAYYLPPAPSSSNLGNADLQISGDVTNSAEYELLFTRGGGAGTAGFLHRETGETYRGMRPLWLPGTPYNLPDLSASIASLNNWQPALITLKSGTILLAYHDGPFTASSSAIRIRKLTESEYTSPTVATISPRWGYTDNYNAGTKISAMPMIFEPQEGVVNLYYMRPELSGTKYKLNLDRVTTTDEFETAVYERNVYTVEFDSADYEELIGIGYCSTSNGLSFALYFQDTADATNNIIRVFGSADGGYVWSELETINPGCTSQIDHTSTLAMWADLNGKITLAVQSYGLRIYEKTALYDAFTLVYSSAAAASAYPSSVAGCGLQSGLNCFFTRQSESDFLHYAYQGQFNTDSNYLGVLTQDIDPNKTVIDSTDEIVNRFITPMYNGFLMCGIYRDASANDYFVAIPFGCNEVYAAPFEPYLNDIQTVFYNGYTDPVSHSWTSTGGFGPNTGNLVNTNGWTVDINGTAEYYSKVDAVAVDKGICVEFGIKWVSGTGRPATVVVTGDNTEVYLQFTNLTATTITISGTNTITPLTLSMTTTGNSLNLFRVVVPAITSTNTTAKVYVFHKLAGAVSWDLVHEETQTVSAGGTPSNSIFIGAGGIVTQTCEFVLYNYQYWPLTWQQSQGGSDVAYSPINSQNPIILASSSGKNVLSRVAFGEWHDGGAAVRGLGGIAAYNDYYTISIAKRYSVSNIFPISEPSPSRVWRNLADNIVEYITLDLGYDGVYPKSGTFGIFLKSNLRDIRISISSTPGDTSGNVYNSLGTGRIGPKLYTNTQGIVKRGGLYPSDTNNQYSHHVRANELEDGWVELAGPIHRNISSNTGGYFIGDGTKAQKCVISLDNVDLTEPTAAGSVTIVTGHLLVLVPGFVPSDTARYLTIYIPNHYTPDGYYEIQQFVAGWFHAFGWAHDESSVREIQYNSATYADAYGRRQYRQLGPKRRAYEVSWGNGIEQSVLYSGSSVSANGSPWRGAALEDATASFWSLDPSASTDSLPEGTFTDVYSCVESAMAAQLPAVLVTDVPNAATASVIEYNLPSRFCYGHIVSDSLREERFGGREDWQDDAVRIATLRFEEDV